MAHLPHPVGTDVRHPGTGPHLSLGKLPRAPQQVRAAPLALLVDFLH